jgi:dephospho-CoA kinase
VAEHSLTAPVIGIIGGVGSGKSSLARRVVELRQEQTPVANKSTEVRKIVILDGDAAGHRVLAEPAVQRQLEDRFGNGVIHQDGTINRRAVAQLVFGTDPVHQQARADLESIVHPRIHHHLEVELAAARSDPATEAVLLDAAVLLEAGWRPLCDAVVFVDTPLEQRLERVSRTRGWTGEQLASRESSQLSLERKRTEADYVVDNSRGLDQAASQLEHVLQQVIAVRRTPS